MSKFYICGTLISLTEDQTQHTLFGILYSTITSASCQRATITELITIVSKTPQAGGRTHHTHPGEDGKRPTPAGGGILKFYGNCGRRDWSRFRPKNNIFPVTLSPVSRYDCNTKYDQVDDVLVPDEQGGLNESLNERSPVVVFNQLRW